MPPSPTAAVSYKKKDGALTLSQDSKYLFFTTTGASTPAVTVPVGDITNLQQTPESSPKVALKVFVKEESYVFSFTSKDAARKEQEAMTEALRNTIAANKAKSADVQSLVSSAPPTPGPGQRQGAASEGQSAAMAIAKAVSSKSVADEGWYDDNRLRSDMDLQRSLLASNKPLQARFNEALKDRPESVSVSQFTSQFWSARLHLLRSHAIEKAQKQGEYNVLPEIRFTRKAAEKEGDPDIKQLHITKEQIKLIFRQYPIVKEAYDENVPPLDAGQFWQRFFSSRLLKRLKGEKVMQNDPPDAIMDKYLERRETGPVSISHIPHFIDLEGNEQNHSQRKGNRPDQDMRPSSFDKVPILRVLNNLSEKMLSHVAPEDGDAAQPIGMDEETYEELRLRDLAREDQDNRVVLNVREQARFVGGDEQDDLSAQARLYAQQDPRAVLDGLQSDLRPSQLGSDEGGTLKLDKVIGYTTDSDSDSEDENSTPSSQQANGTKPSKKKKAPVGSHAAMNAASTSILKSINTRRTASSADPTSLQGLTQQTFDQLTITHNTTTEFLHYFWTLFLSGDPSHSQELQQLVSTLDRCMDRINAVAATAEEERQKKVDGMRQQFKEIEKRTGKRRKLDEGVVGGGRSVVDAMIGPTVKALGVAGEAYRKALEEQTREVGMSGT